MEGAAGREIGGGPDGSGGGDEAFDGGGVTMGSGCAGRPEPGRSTGDSVR